MGKVSQTFVVPDNWDVVSGKYRFLSNEWPRWYGSQYNDCFAVYISTPTGIQVLAKGDLNNLQWGLGLYGYSGITATMDVSVSLKSYRNKTVTYTIIVSDVGDMVVDSALGVTGLNMQRPPTFEKGIDVGWQTNTNDVATVVDSSAGWVRINFRWDPKWITSSGPDLNMFMQNYDNVINES